MKNYQKKALKYIGLETALLIALLITQIGVQFAQSYKWVGFQKKDQTTWVGIAETAQADYQNCQADLDQAKADKDAAIKAANPDLYQPLK